MLMLSGVPYRWVLYNNLRCFKINIFCSAISVVATSKQTNIDFWMKTIAHSDLDRFSISFMILFQR
jgi:hypothetical protein